MAMSMYNENTNIIFINWVANSKALKQSQDCFTVLLLINEESHLELQNDLKSFFVVGKNSLSVSIACFFLFKMEILNESNSLWLGLSIC